MMMLLRMEVRTIKMTMSLDEKIEKGDGDDGYGDDGNDDDYESLLLRHWYEIMALYYVKSILTEISASRQDRRVLQKSKIIRIKFLSIWGMLQTSGYV